MNALGTSVAFSPLVPWLALYIFAGVGVALVAATFFLRARGGLTRGLAMALLWLILANPSLVVENRQPLRDIALVVVDESPSQNIEARDKKTAEALDHVRASLKRLGNIEIRVVRAGIDRNEDGTLMFGAIERALTDIPRNRLAGVVLITDGQIHDAPKPNRMLRNIGPLHVLLTGKRGEADRRLEIKNAPAFGLLGKPLAMTLRIDDEAATAGERAQVTIKRDGVAWKTITVATNRDVKVALQLDHRGMTFFELEVAKGRKELTLENNRKVVTVHGVRDRLRVLLISGEPHPGERAWRNLLKSDPGVDLVHFTILRPPEKRDMTPVNELALISFPVRELFQEKLNQFHLIIFDRYKRRGVIRTRYLQNIADYVRNGGALMVAAGPAYAGPLSLQNTPIGPLLPSRPTGQVFNQGFRPKRTDLGKRHPVTASLTGSGVGPHPWGRWFRQIEATRQRGTTLLSGINNSPLLVLDRVGKGRVAQLLSDQGWLWDRGFEGGGPYAEMLRRVAHWLMKEPELEEESLSAHIQGKRLTVLRRSLKPINRQVDVTAARQQDRHQAAAQGPRQRHRGRRDDPAAPRPVPDHRRQAVGDGRDRLAQRARDGRRAHHRQAADPGGQRQQRQLHLAGQRRPAGDPDDRFAARGQRPRRPERPLDRAQAQRRLRRHRHPRRAAAGRPDRPVPRPAAAVAGLAARRPLRPPPAPGATAMPGLFPTGGSRANDYAGAAFHGRVIAAS